jgi:antitoxin CptB
MTMDEARLRRLRYRVWRRGFKEIDLIVGHFFESHAHQLTDAELDELELLLDEQDQDLYAYIIGTLETPAHLDGPMLHKLRDLSRLSDQIVAASGADD